MIGASFFYVFGTVFKEMSLAAVGLSMGSECCVVATSVGTARSEVVANDAGDRATPTYVALVAGEVLIGESAKNALVRYPMQTVPHLLPLTSADIVRDGKFRVACEVNVREDDDRVEFAALNTDDEDAVHDANSLLSQFLSRMKSSTIDGACGAAPMQSVVVSVPRYLPAEGIKSVVEGAGFASSTIQVICADTAAVLAYQSSLLDSTSNLRCVLVADWGATTCCLSLLGITGGVVRYISHKVSYTFGCRVIDKELQRQIALAFQKKTRMDPTDNARAMRKLLIASEGCKKILSTATTTSVELEAFCEGIDLKEAMSRMKLDMFIRDKGLPSSFDALLDELLEESAEEGLEFPIDALILCGGALKVPLLAQHVKHTVPSRAKSSKFGSIMSANITVLDNISADEVSAVGACHQAVVLNGSKGTMPCDDEQQVHALGCNLYFPLAAFTSCPVADGALQVPQELLSPILLAGTPLPSDVTIVLPEPLSASQLMPILVQVGEAHDNIIPVQALSAQTVELPAGSSKVSVIVTDTKHGSVAVHIVVDTSDGKKVVLTKDNPVELNPV